MDFKNTLLKKLLLLFIFIVNISAYSQNFVPFTTKYNNSLKGDMLLIGNNVLNRSSGSNLPNDPYNGTANNNDFNTMEYIDVDGDPSTFCSSSANLTIPVATSGCYTIEYAALYWAGMYKQADINSGRVNRANFDKVKFKLPGAGAYTNITGNIIYDSFPTDLSANSKGYVSVADVTTLVQGLANANGTYTVADLITGSGSNTSGGWTLYIVYSDPLATAKNITLFEGFSAIGGTNTLNIPITGFSTIPVGPVRAKLAFSSLEGDYGYTGDRLRINGTNMTIPTRPANNFFNASINDIAGAFTARVPNSTNLLGFDAGIINVPNPGNGVIANGDTSATVSLVTNGDSYFYYMNAFAVEIIQPDINLIKIVRDLAGNNIANNTVALGQELYYDLDFQNIGNDGATSFTITDVLPINVDFIPADLILPPGVTYTYNALTHTIVFTIPDSLVTQGGANYQIRIKVRVLDDCNNLRDACSNEIRNQAFKTYSSLNSGNVVENGTPSASGINSCLILEPGTTNFIADIDDCTFTRDEILCGNNVVLTAGSGYLNYQWHSGAPPTAANLIVGATSQSYTATALGTYSVVNTAPAPCLSITETINVIDFNGAVPNPVIPFADDIDICPNDGSELPQIYLCGANDSQLIQTNILNATSIVWEVLDQTSCPVAIAHCPNTNTTCTWNQVGTGPNFNATSAGQYRVRIVFQNGCFRTYYFNVFQNVFTPTETHSDIICGTNGNITVNGVPAGYEFSLTGLAGSWQTSNIFTIPTQGTYTVYIRLIGGGVGNCIFTIPNIQIINRNFTVNVIVTDALCNNARGSIRVQVNNVNPQYTYTLYQGATLVNSVGPINPNDYTFSNLNPGTYTVNVLTTDGCTYSETVTIINPPILTVTAGITIPLTCNPGQITVYPVGGTPPYTYTISGTPGFQAVPEFEILTAGTYTFTVTDFNGCTAATNLTITNVPPPVFTVTQTDVLCYGDASGQISFNVTNTNGYTLLYSIDNGVTFSSNPVFSNLVAGNYDTLVQYSLAGSVCLTVVQTITIGQPIEALTASGGVSELAGCGPSGEGKVRITNPQGGTPAYEYSFDNGVTYGPINEAYLAPGTYTIYIRDANGCTYPMVVTIDPAPIDPTITVNNPVFNCDGTSSSTITVNNNGGSFAYTYLLDGTVNTNVPDNVFVDVPCGNHTITVQYQNLLIPTYSNLLYEDFGRGANTISPGIAAAYCWNNQPYPATTPCGNNAIPGYSPVCGSYTIEDNQYDVTSAIIPNNCNWHPYRDHTSNGTDPTGRFLAVNIGSAAGPFGILYSKTINNVLPNQPIIIDVYLANLLRVGVNAADPDFIFELVNGSGTVVASQSTGIIDNTVNDWQLRTVTLNPGSNTTLTFNIRSGSILYSGNDAAIDDINVYQEPIACITEVNYPIILDCSAAFSAQITRVTNVNCNGAASGQIVIAAQNFGLPYGFDYSIDGGTTWINSTTSPVIISGLVASTYNIVVRYDNSATTCSFPFTQIITEPAVLVANASLTSPATCLNGGTITASASGGTPNYQYQLQNAAATILVPYQANPVFTNLAPGTYFIVVKDVSGCTDIINASIVIPAPVNPTATVDVTSDLCYDGTNAATIVVAASGGVPPYQYSLNGGLNQASNTFSGLTPGSYTIIVTDSYGCTFTIPAVTIQPQLTANVTITSNLNCTASPEAIISGTITGGTAPYSYQVSYNASALSTAVAVVGSTFTHNAPTAGTYQFTITDAIGCTYVTPVVTVAPLPILNPPVLAVTSPIRCFGDATAAISVTNSGGLPPYTINVLNTTTGVNYGTQTSGLTAGNYTVTVTDANSCTAFQTIVINQPAAIAFTSTSVNIQCGALGTEPGSIDISGVTGGTSPYTYIVSNSTGTYTSTFGPTAATSHSFIILNFGVYTITVVDANGCQLSRTNTVSSPPNSLTINPIIIPTTDCLAGGSIQVCVNTPVPVGPYFFAIYQDLAPAVPGYQTFPGVGYQPADITDPTGQCSTFTGLTPGVTYSFIVYDQGTNCYYFETATSPVDTNSSMVVSNDAVANVTCTGADDGNVSFTFSNYSATTAGVSYQIFYSAGNTPVLPVLIGTSAPLGGAPVTISNFGPLAPGQYYILLTENDGPNAGCSITSANFTILESPLELDLLVNVTKNDNCNVNAGQITVTGLDGTPAYSYQLVPAGGPVPTVLTWAGQASNVFNVEGGTYDIYIKDAFNCIRFALGVFVPTDTNPDISLSLEAATLCNTVEGNYSIRVTRNNTVGISPFTYSVDGSAFATYTEDVSFSFLLTGLNSGLHTVIIKDVNGCTETETITISPPLSSTVTPTVAAVQNCGASDGIITVNATGGTGVYNYSIAPNPAIITLIGNVFSNVPAGPYTITVTDATTLCTFDIPVTLATPAPVTFTATPTDVTCNTGSDGSISIALTGVTSDPVYMYEITAPIVRAPQTSNVFTGLPADSYTVVVTSGRGCFTSQVVAVGEPAAVTIPAATLVVTQFGCTTGNTSNNATIVVNGVTGGSGTYVNYEFILGGTIVQSGTSNTYVESNPLGGFYTINVYDNNGCSGTINATIDPFIRISFSGSSVTVTQDITCVDTENITINVTNTGGLAPNLEYIVTGLGGNPYSVTQLNNPNFTGLTIGNYSITVNNLDTGCSIETVHLVFNPNTFIVTAAVTSNVICYGSATGSATLTFIDQTVPTDEAGPFNYTVIHQGTGATVASGTSAGITQVLTGLIAGVYEVQTTLVATPECPAVTNFTITQPAALLTINATSTRITCNEVNNGGVITYDGTISASALNGWGAPYEFQLELGATIITAWSSVTNFIDLGPGNYTVRVRDSRGCEEFTTVLLVIPTPITGTINASTAALPCVGDTTASITITGVSGGEGSNYLYVLTNTTTGISTAPQTSNVFNDLGAGTYEVTISDSFTCEFTTGTVTISEPLDVVIGTLTMTVTPTCGTGATLTLVGSGGTAPYRYSTTAGGPYSPLPVTFTNVLPGTYQYYVIDANDCIEVVSNAITVEPVVPLSVTVDLVNAVIHCSGDTTTITAIATNGLGNYTYILTNLTGPVVTTNNTGVFNNITAGNYTLQVTSGDCTLPIPINISIVEPDPILFLEPDPIQQSCPGDAFDAFASVAPVSGGTPPYYYSITPHFEVVTSGDFYNLGPGIYTIRIIDSEGCQAETLPFQIIELLPLGFSSFNVFDELCIGDGGSVDLQITGGTSSGGTVTPEEGYSLVFNGNTYNSPTGEFSSVNVPEFANLPAGLYEDILITDDNGCEFKFNITILPGLDIQAGYDIIYPCTGTVPTNELTVSYNSTIALADLTFSLDGGTPQASNVFTALSPGNHIITVTHANTCSVDLPVFVDSYSALDLTLTESGLNTITATATGGLPAYVYTFIDSAGNVLYIGSNPVYQISATDTYTVIVTDANECVDMDSIPMTFYDIVIPDYFTPDGDGNNDGWSPHFADNFPNIVTYVFDRYSRVIITLRQGQEWDGTYNNSKLPTGDYWYVIKLNGETDAREFVGNFTLYR
jgi:large repetitive protein